MRSPRWLFTFVVALVVVLASCGGDDTTTKAGGKSSESTFAGVDDETDSSADESTDETGDSADGDETEDTELDGDETDGDAISGVDAPDAEDQQAAEGALLKISDFPDDWTASDSDSSDDDDEEDSAPPGCERFDTLDDLGTTTAKAKAEFGGPNNETVSSEIEVLTTSDAVKTGFELFNDPALPDCLVKALQQGASDDSSSPKVQVKKLPSSVRDSIGFRLAIAEIDLNLDIVLIARGRTAGTLTVAGSISADVEQKLIETFATRLEKIPA